MLGSAENGIYRAGLNALGATDALILAYVGYFFDALFPVFFVKERGIHIQQVSQRLNTRLSAWGTLVNILTFGYRLSIGPTSGVPTLAALGLRQNLVDLVDYGIAFGLETDCGVAQQGAENQAQANQRKQGSK